MNIRPFGAEFVHSDRRDEATNSRFSRFCELA